MIADANVQLTRNEQLAFLLICREAVTDPHTPMKLYEKAARLILDAFADGGVEVPEPAPSFAELLALIQQDEEGWNVNPEPTPVRPIGVAVALGLVETFRTEQQASTAPRLVAGHLAAVFRFLGAA